MHKCSKCRQVKPLSAFPRSKGWWCKDCRNRAQRERRARAVEMLGGKCVGCGETRPGILQIDHIDRVENNHSRKRIKTVQTVYAVLRGEPGHQLLCANCHSLKSQAEAAWELFLDSRM